MNVIVDLTTASNEAKLPSQEDFQSWSSAVMAMLKPQSLASESFELSIKVVDETESTALNQDYRQKDGSTNILSFPYQGLQLEQSHFLGDLVICAPVVKREAEQQGKTHQAHWAHMTVHGTLHLNAYDHEDESDAKTMEQLEIDILDTLGFDNPYQALNWNGQ